jgi:hypothetical protein
LVVDVVEQVHQVHNRVHDRDPPEEVLLYNVQDLPVYNKVLSNNDVREEEENEGRRGPWHVQLALLEGVSVVVLPLVAGSLAGSSL